MDNLHNRLKVEPGRKDEIFYYSYKEDLKTSKTAKFGVPCVQQKARRMKIIWWKLPPINTILLSKT